LRASKSKIILTAKLSAHSPYKLQSEVTNEKGVLFFFFNLDKKSVLSFFVIVLLFFDGYEFYSSSLHFLSKLW